MSQLSIFQRLFISSGVLSSSSYYLCFLCMPNRFQNSNAIHSSSLQSIHSYFNLFETLKALKLRARASGAGGHFLTFGTFDNPQEVGAFANIRTRSKSNPHPGPWGGGSVVYRARIQNIRRNNI